MNETIDFLTESQILFMNKIRQAGRDKVIVRLEAPLGCGLQHATTQLIKKSPGFKIVFIDCEQADFKSSRKIFVKLLLEATSVRLSNLNYQNVAIDEFGQVLRKRLQQDLKDQNLVVIFDHLNTLSKTALHQLLNVIHEGEFKFGIVVRSTEEHKLALRKKEPLIHDLLYFDLTDNVVVVERNSKDEMRIFIKDVLGITEQSFIMDLVKARFGFSKCKKLVKRYNDKFERLNS